MTAARQILTQYIQSHELNADRGQVKVDSLLASFLKGSKEGDTISKQELFPKYMTRFQILITQIRFSIEDLLSAISQWTH